MQKNEIEKRLREERLEQLSHGHDWDVADVLPVVLELLADAWNEGWDERAVVKGPACPTDHNPYREP